MGQYAEDLLDGVFDSVTGEYIGEGVGYPRTVTNPRRSQQMAVSGITKYIAKQQIKEETSAVVVKYFQYLLSIGEVSKREEQTKWRDKCERIQQDFGQFRLWLINVYKKQPKT